MDNNSIGVELSFSQRIIQRRKPFVLCHTHLVTEEILSRAMAENKSIDLDVSIDDQGNPYLGHSQEYYRMSGNKPDRSMPLWEAVEKVAAGKIPVVVDCKDARSWQVIEEVIGKIGPHRCLADTFVSELKFDYSYSSSNDYPIEFSPIERLRTLREKFPNLTLTASCKFLPDDFFTAEKKYRSEWERIRNLLVANNIDTVSFNVQTKTMSDDVLNFFLEKEIILKINIDGYDLSKVTSLYVGESDVFESMSSAEILGY